MAVTRHGHDAENGSKTPETALSKGQREVRTIYKICPSFGLSQGGVGTGFFAGSAADARDGFIHFSTMTQLSDTAEKHFAGIETCC